MTDVLKPFKILSTRLEPGGSTGVEFEAEKVEITEPRKRNRMGVRTYISVPAGEDVDLAVFNYLQESGWL